MCGGAVETSNCVEHLSMRLTTCRIGRWYRCRSMGPNVNILNSHRMVVIWLATVMFLVIQSCKGTILDGGSSPRLVVATTQVNDSDSVGTTTAHIHAIPIGTDRPGTAGWQATAIRGSQWLTVREPFGTAPDTLHVLVDATGLAPGTYRDTILVLSTLIPIPAGDFGLIPVELGVHP